MLRDNKKYYNDKIEYKGYIGKVLYDGDSKIFFGEVINSPAIITFVGDCVDEIAKSFEESVEAYLNYCKEIGEDPTEPPQKTYSGKLTVRLSPDLHRYAAERALFFDVSLNEFIIDALEKQLVNT